MLYANTRAFCIRDWSVWGFGYPWGLLKQSPVDTEGGLYAKKLGSGEMQVNLFVVKNSLRKQ